MRLLLQALAKKMSNLHSKFRGTLIGGLVGDCFGAPFEDEGLISKSVLTNFLNKSLIESDKAIKVHTYTDDSIMARGLAESLLENNGFNGQHLARRFAEDYFKEPAQRYYGGHIPHVFQALINGNCEDPFGPAMKQFNGSGSYGNGAAMRATPLPLFGYNFDNERFVDLISDTSKITHTHRNGINGAILQCLAIRKALRVEAVKLNTVEFIDDLIDMMRVIESEGDNTEMPFTEKLVCVKNLLLDEDREQRVNSNSNPNRIADLLGNNVTAVKSVPTAIYTFLRSQDPIEEYATDNVFLRNLYLSISIGGDTDTIASMSSSIVGACHGVECIPPILIKRSEASDVFLSLADQLHEKAMA